MSAPIRSFMTQLKVYKETQPWIYIPTTTSSFKILDAVDKFSADLYEQLAVAPETLEVPLLESEGGEDWIVRCAELSIQPDENVLIIDEEEIIAFSQLRHVCERNCPFRNKELHFIDVLYIHQGNPRHLYIDIADGLLCLRLINMVRKIIFINATSFEPVLGYLSPRFLEVSVDVDSKDKGPINGETNSQVITQAAAAPDDQRPTESARSDEENADALRARSRSTTPGQEELEQTEHTNSEVIDVQSMDVSDGDKEMQDVSLKASSAASNVEDENEKNHARTQEEDEMESEESAEDKDGETVEEKAEDKVDGTVEENVGGIVTEEARLSTEMKPENNTEEVSQGKTEQETNGEDTEETSERVEAKVDEKAEGESKKETKEEKTEAKSEGQAEATSDEVKAEQPGTAEDEAPTKDRDLETDAPMQMKPPTSMDAEITSSSAGEKPETEKPADTHNMKKEDILDVYISDDDGDFPEDEKLEQKRLAQTQKRKTGAMEEDEKLEQKRLAQTKKTKTGAMEEDERMSAETATGDEKPEETKAEEGKPEEGKPEEKKAEEGKPEEGKPEEKKAEEGKPEETKAEERKPEETKAEKGKPEKGKPEEKKAEEGKPEEGKPEETNAEERKPEEGKPEETKAEEGKPEERKPEETKAEETKAEEGKPEETKAEEGKAATGEEDGTAHKLSLMEMAPGYIGFYRGFLQRSPLLVALLLEEPGEDVVEFIRYNAARGIVYVDTPSHGFSITGKESQLQEVTRFLRNNAPMPSDHFNDMEALASHLYSQSLEEERPQEAATRNVSRLPADVTAGDPSRLQQRDPNWRDEEVARAQEKQQAQMMSDESIAIARSKIEFLDTYTYNIHVAANPEDPVLLEFLNSNWTPMELDIKEKVEADLIPEADCNSLALDPDDIDHFTKAMNDVQEYLMNMDPVMALSRLRTYRDVFQESSMREMKAIFEAFDEVAFLKALYVMALMQNMS